MPEPFSAGLATLKMPTLIAGFFGALVSLRFAAKLSKWGKATAIISGMMISYFITPAAVHLFQLQTIESPLAFLIGLFGLNFTAAVHSWVRDVDVPGILKSRFGNGE